MRDALAARGTAFAITLLPVRQALEAPGSPEPPAQQTRRRMHALTAQLGIRTLDAWDLFAAAVQRDGAARYFRPQDIHFTAQGHRLVADWLATQLPPTRRDMAPPAAAASGPAPTPRWR